VDKGLLSLAREDFVPGERYDPIRDGTEWKIMLEGERRGTAIPAGERDPAILVCLPGPVRT